LKKLILAFFILIKFCTWAQIDTTKEEKEINRAFLETSIESSKTKDPKIALRLAAFAPGVGLGQIYNHKYWKLPLIYGAEAFVAYRIISFNQTYTELRSELYRRDLSAKHPELKWNTSSEDLKSVSTESIRTNKDLYRIKRDRMVLMAFGLYGLTILDAYIDAHLSNFNIDKKRTLSFRPSFIPSNQTAAIGLSFKWNL
jgi:hypothetical protein